MAWGKGAAYYRQFYQFRDNKVHLGVLTLYAFLPLKELQNLSFYCIVEKLQINFKGRLLRRTSMDGSVNLRQRDEEI